MQRTSSLENLHQQNRQIADQQEQRKRNRQDDVPLRISNKIAKTSTPDQLQIAVPSSKIYGKRPILNRGFNNRLSFLKSQGVTAHKLKAIRELFKVHSLELPNIFSIYGFEKGKTEAANIFWDISDKVLEKIDIEKLKHIKCNIIDHTKPHVFDFYRTTPMEKFDRLTIDQMKQIDICLQSHSETARDFIKNNGVDRLKYLETDEIIQLRQGLESASEFARDFYKDNINDIMLELTLDQQKSLQSMIETPSSHIKDFVMENSVEQIGHLSSGQIDNVTKGLTSLSPRARLFFEHNPIEKLAEIDGGVMNEIILGLESTSGRTVKFFEKINIDDIKNNAIDDDHLRQLRTVLDDDNGDVRHYFQNISIDDVSNENQVCNLELIREGLLHEDKIVSDYFKDTVLSDFEYAVYEELETIIHALSEYDDNDDGNHKDFGFFLKNNTFRQTSWIVGGGEMSDLLQRYEEGMENFNPNNLDGSVNLNDLDEIDDPNELIQALNRRKEQSRNEYFSKKPDNIPIEQMQMNIDSLFHGKIDEVIEYSQKAINELNMSPEEVYGQRFDRAAFKEERYAKYATTMMDFLQQHRPADEYRLFQQFAPEVQRDIALRVDPEYIDPEPQGEDTTGALTYPQNLINIAQTSRAAHRRFLDAYNALRNNALGN